MPIQHMIIQCLYSNILSSPSIYSHSEVWSYLAKLWYDNKMFNQRSIMCATLSLGWEWNYIVKLWWIFDKSFLPCFERLEVKKKIVDNSVWTVKNDLIGFSSSFFKSPCSFFTEDVPANCKNIDAPREWMQVCQEKENR